MSNINQIIASSLLTNISKVNSNNKNSLNTNSNPFDEILKNSLGSSMGLGSSCSCTCNNGSEILDMMATMLGALNNAKLEIPNVVYNSSITNNNSIASNHPTTNNNLATNNNSTISNNLVNEDSKMSGNVNKAIALLEKQVGKPYVWGANGPESFDCSGLVRYIYKTSMGKDIPRVSYDQSKFGQEVDKKDLQPGDLVFFDTMNKGRVSHVGMYVGNDEFIHASNPKDGVVKSKLSSSYYEKTYKGARRP